VYRGHESGQLQKRRSGRREYLSCFPVENGYPSGLNSVIFVHPHPVPGNLKGQDDPCRDWDETLMGGMRNVAWTEVRSEAGVVWKILWAPQDYFGISLKLSRRKGVAILMTRLSSLLLSCSFQSYYTKRNAGEGRTRTKDYILGFPCLSTGKSETCQE